MTPGRDLRQGHSRCGSLSNPAGTNELGRNRDEARILQIIPTLDRGGAEKQMSLLATGLPRDEFDVHVCALTRGGPLSAELGEPAFRRR